MNNFIIRLHNNNGDYMKKDNEQTIECSVHDCKHCDCGCNMCELDKIKVRNCNGDGEKETTMCNSYEKKKD